MQGVPTTSFWGKLTSGADGDVVAWHPLVDHCADVAACCEALLEHSLLRRRLAALAYLDDLTPEQVHRLCVLAALHDAGKVNLGFQAKARAGSRLTAGHVRPLFALVASRFAERDAVLAALGVDELLEWGPEGLIFAAIAHHGQPVGADAHGAEADPKLWAPGGQLDPISGLRELGARAREWFPKAAGRGAALPDAPALQHAFSGLVTLADWLGSDTSLFPFSETGAPERIGFARERARAALRAMGLDAGPARSRLELGTAWFDRFFGFPARDAQRTVLDLPVPPEGGVIVLEAETGSGKTEAALARFLVLFKEGSVDGLYFALPTRTAATQIHARVSAAVANAFPDPGVRPPVILAVPGYVRVDDVVGTREDPKLPPFRTLWPDDPADSTRWRRWAAESPKRYLAGQIAVGTVDQVLLSSLRVKHAHLRATSLVRHLLVVDEVHASDAYMNRVLEAVLARHVSAGGHALLMSATLGAAARSRFLAPGAAPQPLALAEQVSYPAISSSHAGLVATSGAGGGVGGKTVDVELAPVMDDAPAVARCAADATAAGARVLVIRNTVGAAVATQAALEELAGDSQQHLFECAGARAPHHSRFSREDRTRLDEELERRFGKGSGDPCAVIATQTVQQSLDIDSDLLVTDLCPMDVLLQRVGRLHRHERTRPARFFRPKVIVLVPESSDLANCVSSRTGEPFGRHGIGRVYRDLRVLQATWDLLASEPQLSIPARNRMYVERTTHPDALAAVVKARTGKWVTHQNWLTGKLMAEVGLAALNEAAWTKPFGEHGWSHEDGRIGTRLGAGDRLVVFDAPFRSPFGASCAALTMPAWMAAGIDEEHRPAQVQPLPGGGVWFEFGGGAYVYDRLGLRKAQPLMEENDDG